MIKCSKKIASSANKGAAKFLKSLIRAYRLLVSPILGHSCRYLPTCSEYGIEAIERHGPIVGSYLIIKRLFRCHPWGGNGLDPVPVTYIGIRKQRNCSHYN